MNFERLFARGNAPKWFNRWFLLAVLVLTATFATGSGLLWGLPTAQSQSGPTQISTVDDLRAIADDLTGNYVLTNDISLLGNNGETVSWTPLGDSSGGFTGTFDGGGFEISNLEVTTATANCEVGLFGRLGVNGTVRNVGLRDVDVSGDGVTNGASVDCDTVETITNYGNGALVGALVGNSRGGQVEASYVVGGTVRGGGHTGGLVGVAAQIGVTATITGSFANVAVEGLSAVGSVGGLLGRSFTGNLRSSYALGDVSGSGATFGGLVGNNATPFVSGAIRRSFATGNVPSGSDNGGLFGSEQQRTGMITESYQTSDSAGANYLSLFDLATAAAGTTTGFATWDDDNCGTDAVVGTGGAVWDFGVAGELPRISCIKAEVQPRVAIADPSVPAGFTGISDAAGLRAIANDLSGSYILTADIDLEETDSNGNRVSWTPIGSVGDAGFSGVFDGGGYEISGLWVTTGTSSCEFGLFGYAEHATGARLRNVGLRDVYVSAEGSCQNTSNVGALAGNSTVPVDSSYVVGGTVRGGGSTGGLVGVSDFSINNSFADVEVVGLSDSAFGDVGGLLGFASFATVNSSYALGNVSGVGTYFGRLVGNSGTVNNSFATGNVPAGSGGGLVGNGGSLTESYQTADSAETRTYLPLADLEAATAATAGFGTWGDANCASEAAVGADGAVWDFGAANLLPRISCISAAAQSRVVPAVVTVSGFTNFQNFDEDAGSVTVSFELDVTPSSPVTVVITLDNSTQATLGEDFTISSETVVLTSAGTPVEVDFTIIDDDIDERPELLILVYTVTAGEASIAAGAPTRFGINDNEQPVVTGFNGFDLVNGVTTVDVREGDPRIEFRLVSDIPPAITSGFFTFNLQSGTTNVDFEITDVFGPSFNTAQVSFNEGETVSGAIFIEAVDDNVAEVGKTVTLVAAPIPGAAGSVSLPAGGLSLVLNLIDDDTPAVTVDTVGGVRTYSETAAAIDLVVSIDNMPASGGVTVDLTPSSGDLVEGVSGDYTLDPQAVTFAAGTSALTETVTLTLINDEVEEELLRTLSIGYVVTGEANVIGSPLELEIMDDDTPEITLEVSGGTRSFQAVEGGDDVVVTVRASKTLRNPIELTVSDGSDGTATAGSGFDYTVMPRTVTLTPSGEATVTVDVLTDDVDEVAEFVSLLFAITDAGDSRASVASGTVVLRVADATVPQLNFSPTALDLNEGGSYETFTVTSDIAVVADVVVDVSVVAGDADQFSISPTSVTIPAGMMASGPVRLAATDDRTAEVTKMVSLGLSLSSGEATFPADNLAVTVNDDDTPRVMVTAIGGTTFSENDGANDRVIMLNVGLSNAPAGGNVIVTLTPSGLGAGDSLPTSMRTVTFTATSALDQQVMLTLNNDEVEEVSHTLDIAYAVTTSGSATANAVDSPLVLTITDDDAPLITFSLENGDRLAEGEMKTITFTTSKQPIDDLTINITNSNNVDSSVSPSSVTFAAGAAAGSTRTVVFTATPDSNNENLEQVNLNFNLVRGNSGASLRDVGSLIAIQAIGINDAPRVTVSAVGGTSFSENNGTNNREITLNVVADAAPVGGNLVVSLAGSGGLNTDEYSLSQPSVTFTPSDSGGALMKTVTLTLMNDEREEGGASGMRTLTITPTVNVATRGTVGSALALTITDDDTPVITIASGAGSLDEGEQTTVTFTLNKTPSSAVVVTVTHNGGSDASLSGGGLVTFPAGAVGNNRIQTRTFTASDDNLDEPDENVALTFVVSGNSRAMVAGGTSVSIMVVDTDVPALSFNPGSLNLGEGEMATFTVESDIAVLADVVVSVAVLAGDDATLFTLSPTSVTIPAGMTTSAPVTLTSPDDNISEAPKVVNLELSLSSGAATVSGGDLAVTVIDDDVATVSVGVASGGGATTVTEGDVVTLEVRLSSALELSMVEVSLSASGLASGEYELSRTSVTFAASATGNDLVEEVTLTLINDNVEEELSRELEIGYTATPSADVEVGSALELTITDDDTPMITVESDADSLEEGEVATLTFTVSRSPSSAVVVNVTHDGGSDASLSGGGLVTFQQGATASSTQTLTFRASNDDLDELDEVVGLTFAVSGGSRAMLAAGTSVSVTVVDTDVPVVTVSALEADESGELTLEFEVDITPIMPLNLAVGFGAGNDGTNGRVTEGEDYAAGSIASSTVTLTVGGEAGRQTLAVALIDDDVVEATEMIEFVVSLVSPLTAADATIGDEGVVVAEVLDDDVPNLTVTVTSAELVEGAEVSEVTLTLDAVLPFDLAVRIGFGGGTASGNDVEFERSVILAAGEGSASFTVRALSDLEDEPEDETLLLVFMADVDGRAAVFADGEGDLITGDAPLEFTVVNVPPPSTGLVLPEFTRVELSGVGGSVGGSLRARLDYEVGGGALYPTSVGWRVLSGSDVFTLGTPVTRELSDGSYEFSVEVIFEAVGTGEIEVFVRQIGAPTEELRVIGTVTSIAPQPSAPPAPFVPPPDPPGVAPVGSVRPSTGADVVEELASGDEVVVEIPPGASNDFLRVEVADVPSSALNSLPQLPSGVEILMVAPVLDIDLMDSNNAEVRRVNRPTRVCLPLSAADYGRVENPALLRVITYHEGAANWDVLNAVYDVGTEQLCAYTSRFSVFAIGLASPQVVLDEVFLPSTGDGGVLGLWGVAGLGLFGAVLIVAGVLVVMRRKFPNFRSARS